MEEGAFKVLELFLSLSLSLSLRGECPLGGRRTSSYMGLVLAGYS